MAQVAGQPRVYRRHFELIHMDLRYEIGVITDYHKFAHKSAHQNWKLSYIT